MAGRDEEERRDDGSLGVGRAGDRTGEDVEEGQEGKSAGLYEPGAG